jgi:hypothetical protein
VTERRGNLTTRSRHRTSSVNSGSAAPKGVYVAPVMTSRYFRRLDPNQRIRMVVEFQTEGPEVTDYAVLLLVMSESGARTIRVYDGAHGLNEMHRHTASDGKQPGTIFHSGTLGEGMRSAIDEITHGYRAMIEGWERQ